MQRRHFELIAASIWRSQAASSISGTAPAKAAARKAIHLVATDIAVSCHHENPNFDKARFMKACGFEFGY